MYYSLKIFKNPTGLSAYSSSSVSNITLYHAGEVKAAATAALED